MDYRETLNTLDHLRSLFEGGGDDSVFDASQKRWISALHKKETGAPVKDCGCKNKYTDAVLLLILRLRKRGELSENRKYKLRPGELIWLGGDCYSSINITDEIAAEWLKAHPDGLFRFEDKQN